MSKDMQNHHDAKRLPKSIVVNNQNRTTNNIMISTTAHEVSSNNSGAGCSGGNPLVPVTRRNNIGPSGSQSGNGFQGSNSSGNNPQPCSVSPELAFTNPLFAQNSYVFYPAYYYNYYLNNIVNTSGLLNVAQGIQHQNQFGYTAQDLRDIYLFRNENVPTPGSQSSSQHTSREEQRAQRELKERELVANLRKWVTVDSTGNSGKEIGLNFTLMSYNVLAQDLITEHAYIYRSHNPRALLWETRWKNLYQEILTHNADIICLQEVQESHLQNYYSKINELGYDSIFKKKNGMRTDGCALYYRKNMFNLIDYITVDYNQGHVVLDRDNVAIIAKLAPIDKPNVEFIVATTHLLYNPRRQDVRVAQTQVLLAEIERMAYMGKNLKYLPIIITGDFNAEPYSAVYELIVTGNLKYDSLTKRTLMPTNATTGLAGKFLIPYSLQITDNCQHLSLVRHRTNSNKTLSREEEETLLHLRNYRDSNQNKVPELDEKLFSTGTLSHAFRLKSAFLHVDNNELEGTTNQTEWITVDYIFYSGKLNNNKTVEEKLKLLSRYSIPTKKQLEEVKTIPNSALGSDHLALLTKFKLRY